MSFGLHSIIAMSQAGPGWQAAILGSDGRPTGELCPIVAWASVVIGYDKENDDPCTEVQPVLVHKGKATTESFLRVILGKGSGVIVMQPNDPMLDALKSFQ
jgi:hypothetical protein